MRVIDLRFSTLFFFPRRSLFYKAKSGIGLSEVFCKNMDHYLCVCVKYIFSQNIYWNISMENCLLERIVSLMWTSWEKMLKNWVVHFTQIQITFYFSHPHVIIFIGKIFYTFIWDRNWYTMLKQLQQMSIQKSRRNTPGVFSELIKMLLIIKRHLQFVNFYFAGQEAKILDNHFNTR